MQKIESRKKIKIDSIIKIFADFTVVYKCILLKEIITWLVIPKSNVFYGQLNLDSTDSQVLSLYTLHFCHNRKVKHGLTVSS